MSLRYNILFSSKKVCFLATVFGALKVSAFAQLTISAAQSPNFAVPNTFAIWYATILFSAAILGTSIFWWRREKSQDETASRRGAFSKNAEERETARQARAAASTNNSDRSDKEVNDDVAAWIQNNIASKNSTGNLSRGTIIGQNESESLNRLRDAIQTANSAYVFQIPEALSPFVPLPVSDDESLLNSIEKVQDIDSSEEERESAINVLINFKFSNAVEALTQVAHYDEFSRLRISALNGLGEFDHESVFEPVLVTCSDPAREVRAAAARTLARLNINRAEAYTRIVESEDPERLRLASMVCIDAGLAKHAFARLTHPDSQQANEAFAMVRLLVAAEQFAPIIKAVSDAQDVKTSLTVIKALKAIKSIKTLPTLYHLTTDVSLPEEVKKALGELVVELSTV